jgi:hypothetical protein
VLALDGFRGVNLVALVLLVPAVVLAVVAVRRRGPDEQSELHAVSGGGAQPDGSAAAADGDHRLRSRTD